MCQVSKGLTGHLGFTSRCKSASGHFSLLLRAQSERCETTRCSTRSQLSRTLVQNAVLSQQREQMKRKRGRWYCYNIIYHSCPSKRLKPLNND